MIVRMAGVPNALSAAQVPACTTRLTVALGTAGAGPFSHVLELEPAG